MIDEIKWPSIWPRPERESASAILAAIVAAAQSGARCPTLQDLQFKGIIRGKMSVRRIAEQGAIRVEVYGRNFRRIFVCAGPHKGLSTMAAPAGRKPPYVVFGPERP